MSGAQPSGLCGLIGRSEQLRVANIIIASFGFALLLIGPTLEAQWSIIDDHETAHFLGKARALSLTLVDLPEFLHDTEVGAFGSVRYRPVYYTLRIVSSLTFGNHPGAWWFTHFLLFAASFAMLWYTLARYASWLVAGLTVFLIFCYGYWADIWCHLGPGEIYCTVGFVMFLLASSMLVERVLADSVPPEKLHDGWLWLVAALGAIVAIGSKENFVLLAPILIAIYILAVIKGRGSVGGAIATGAVATSAALIVWSILIALKSTGSDVYGNQVDIGSAVSTAVEGLEQEFSFTGVLCAAALMILAGALMSKRPDALRAYFEMCAIISIGYLALLGFLVSQHVFYSGKWPTGMRYDFPGKMLPVLYAFLVFAIVLRTLRKLNVSDRVSRVIEGLVVLVLLSAAVQGVVRGLPLREAAHVTVELSREFTAALHRLAVRAKGDPTQPILFKSNSPSDKEPIASVRQFLLAAGVTNDMYLSVSYGPHEQREQFPRRLAQFLNQVSHNGLAGPADKTAYNETYSAWGFLPLKSMPDVQPLVVLFNTERHLNPQLSGPLH